MIDEFGNETDEDNAGDVGGLSMYSDPNVQKAMAKIDALAKQQKDRYDAQALALAEKRYGPSFSERMFQLSAAFATPTKQRGLGAVLGNVSPVLAAQQQAKRAGELSRREALDKLDAERFAQEVGLAKQGLTTATAMARIAQQGTGVGQTYDQTRGIFVNRRNPRPTQNAYTDPTTKRTFVQWQDGLWRETQPDGSYKVFEREGAEWVELDAKGAR
jgi:hypothetical protein